MTPERKKVFESALQDPKMTAPQLTTLADSFHSSGLKAEAAELKKRAAILTAPPHVVQARTEAFKKAIKSTNAAAVAKVAAAFHAMGHYQAATKLRTYARGLVGFKASAAPTAPSVTAGIHIGEE
jgi:hypothetical protein